MRNLTRSIRELRFHLCQKSPGSDGLREFIKNNYIELKKNHPSLPILVREAPGTEAKVYAAYGTLQMSPPPK